MHISIIRKRNFLYHFIDLWRLSTDEIIISGFAMVCLGFSALAIISEGIKIYQNHLKLKAKSNSQHCHSSRCSSETEMLLSNEDSGNQTSKWLTALKITTVYTLQMTVSYLLMLIVMTYNGYFTIALALGGLVGYLLFGSVLYNWEDKHLLKKKCHSCLESLRNNENVPENNDALPNTVDDSLHFDSVQEPQSAQNDLGNCCHESIVQVHNVDV